MRISKRTKTASVAATAALALVPLLAAGAEARALPYPSAATPKAIDLGGTASLEGDAPITVTVALRLRDAEGARRLLESLTTPGDAAFHRFLTPQQFVVRFAPPSDAVERASAALAAFGLEVNRATTTTLRVTGTAAALERAFATSLHTFSVAPYDGHPGYRYRAPVTAVTIPAAAAPAVCAVLGLDTRPALRPHLQARPGRLRAAASGAAASQRPDASDAFGSLTVADFAKHYNVTPLYDQGISGKGRMLAIVTLASFTPSDAFAYWAALGLSVSSDRIKIVNVDGGPGAPSDDSGSLETTIDVEQSGGLAPGADIIVYQAPNTNQAFVDAFALAVDQNKAQSISTSWGEWEWWDDLANAPVTDPDTGKTVSSLYAMDELFLQAALQGQSLFAASGDAGAYDADDGTDADGNPFLPPDYSLALSVDYPASDPYITASGGTTLPGKQVYTVSGQPDYVVKIPKERVWSWDYLEGLCTELGYTSPIACGIFPVGSGGGVSVFFRRPYYQFSLAGVQDSQPDQAFVDYLTIPPTTLFDLPAGYAGRNVPDVSANADPDTGYVVYYTSSVSGFSAQTFWGGTSFVAPQLNGAAALLGEYLKTRLSLLNIPLYQLAKSGGYRGGGSAPLKAIVDGNNDFYTGSPHYDPAAGLGVLNFGSLAGSLQQIFGQ